jgi:pre-mRNA-processing factor 19
MDEDVPAKRAKGGITPDIVEAMTKHSSTLSKARKKRTISETLATPEEVASLALLGTFPLQKTTQPGILGLDFVSGMESLVVTAGADHTGKVYDRDSNRLVTTLTGHSKKVTDVKFLGGQDTLLTTSADKTARVWKSQGEEGGFASAAILSDHTADITAAAVHVTNDYFITASLDKTWAFYDVATATCLHQVSDPDLTAGYTSAKFHPDGLILGAGTQDSKVRIWEVRAQKNVATLGHTKGAVTSISFSENGYYLATAASDGVKLWDLRKLLNFKDLAAPDASFVAFDHSGLYLAVGGSQVNVHAVKQDWQVVNSFSDLPKKGAYCGKWGADARSLLVGASDHNLRIYGQAA